MKKQPKFCPLCSGELELNQLLKILVCDKCGYQFWRNAKPTVSAIIFKDNKVLLAKRSTKKFFGYWDAPGGFLDNGEDPLIGLKREAMEETGVEIRVKGLINMIREEDYENPLENSLALAIQFLCEIVNGEPKPLHETTEVKWFSKEEIPWEKIAFPGVKEALEIEFGLREKYLPSR